MNKIAFIPFAVLLLGSAGYGQVETLARLPNKLNENSGLSVLGNDSAWLIEDGGNDDNIYEIGLDGSILKAFEVTNAKNTDWEDLAADPDGNLYISDTGNNALDREELVIYKIRNPVDEPGDKIPAEKIRFRYGPDGIANHKKKHPRHDAEALFYRSGWLYIITKDRGKPFTGNAVIYKVPAMEGFHEAAMVGVFNPCKEQGSCEITAADISPDGKKIALLGYGQLWIFSGFDGEDFTKGTLKSIGLGFKTQLEAVAFLDMHTLLLSDEEKGSEGRYLYKLSID